MKNRKEKNTLFMMLHYFPYEIIKKKKEQSQYLYTCTVAVLCILHLTNYRKIII